MGGDRRRGTAVFHRGIPLVAVFLAGRAWAQVSPGALARPHRSLEGNSKCLECHASKKEGMDARCLACHQEIAFLRDAQRGLHARTENAPCAACHPDHAGEDFQLIDWPEGVSGFDHARAGWPLTGKHAAVKCRDCHQPKYRAGEAARRAKVKDPAKSWVGLESNCAGCHSDAHKGALGSDCAHCHGTVDWKKTPGFDHAATAFPLTGKHAPVPCAKCHLSKDAAIPVYKPLPHAECSTCHVDPHVGRLGAKCASCHVTTSFREVPKSAFDHDRTRWPLTGGHRGVTCARCHDAKTAWGAKPAFATCGACHQDPHQGQATLAGSKVDCASCHATAGFRPGVLPLAKHAPDQFPLAGLHAGVPCAKCHTRDETPKGRARLGKAALEMRPAGERCLACHADRHGGQLASRPDGGECAPCHSVAGWKPSLFTADRHAKATLPLEGAHARIACAACHGLDRKGLAALSAAHAGNARVVLVGIENECAGCHVDPHRFEPTARCTDCHDAKSFAPARYGAVEHARARFALEGAHRAVPCFACHAELNAPRTKGTLMRAASATRPLPLRVSKQLCADCHKDPHGGQFATPTAKACGGCHDAARFRPAARFEHDRDARFRLGSAHAELACAKCHTVKAVPGDAAPLIRWRGVSSKCEACHGKKATEGGGRN